jgi:hypothetical protein
MGFLYTYTNHLKQDFNGGSKLDIDYAKNHGRGGPM